MSVSSDAALAATLFALDPVGLGGACLRSFAHPVREQWLVLLRDLMPPHAPWRRLPCTVGGTRLLGGLDLAATLAANRPIAERGALAASHGGIVIISMAERLSAHTAAALVAVLDVGEVAVLYEGWSARAPAEFGLVVLDDGIGDEEYVRSSVLDRLAFLIDFEGLSPRSFLEPLHDAHDILAARRLLPDVVFPEDILERLCGTALALGVTSPRVSLLAARAARASAALDLRTQVTEDDAIVAGRLVLAPRATLAPAEILAPPGTPIPAETLAPGETRAPGETSASPEASASAETCGSRQPPSQSLSLPVAADSAAPTDDGRTSQRDKLPDAVLAAVQAAIPPGLLSRLRSGLVIRGGKSGVGRAGSQHNAVGRGRPIGVRPGAPRGNVRLNILETLRAAAPWQRLRGRGLQGDGRLRVNPADFRITVTKQRARTLTIFAVDASGSAALNRLAEAKGAVELLLAECYLRRDQVAVIAFRGRSAELILPPTRSLVRAKRSLAGMAGGGGTPLAAALGIAVTVGLQAQRRGETPTLVVLSDGRANIARDGSAGREVAHRDTLAAARAIRAARLYTLFVDTSPRPNALAQALANALNARYVPLPFVSSQALSDLVSASVTSAAR